MDFSGVKAEVLLKTKQSRRLASLSPSETVQAALDTLSTRNFRSAPVMSDEQTLLGFIDNRDMVAAVLEILDQKGQSNQTFLEMPVEKLINKSGVNKAEIFESSISLRELGEQMLGLRLHRAVVKDSNSGNMRIVTMSDLINVGEGSCFFGPLYVF